MTRWPASLLIYASLTSDFRSRTSDFSPLTSVLRLLISGSDLVATGLMRMQIAGDTEPRFSPPGDSPPAIADETPSPATLHAPSAERLRLGRRNCKSQTTPHARNGPTACVFAACLALSVRAVNPCGPKSEPGGNSNYGKHLREGARRGFGRLTGAPIPGFRKRRVFGAEAPPPSFEPEGRGSRESSRSIATVSYVAAE